MSVLNPQEKLSRGHYSRVVDFPEDQTRQIYSNRWHNTAYMMGLSYKEQPVHYGEHKVRLEFLVEGEKKKVKEFLEFVDETLALAVDTDKWPDVP